MKRPKDKGTKAESHLVAWLRDHGHPEARRNPAAGGRDVGDVHCLTDRHAWPTVDVPVVVEVKNHANVTTAIRDGLRELDAEKANAGTVHGVLVVKPPGVGLERAGDWYAVRRVADDPELGGEAPDA